MKPVALIVLDGWGYRVEREGNAVVQARTPVFARLWKTYPHCYLKTSGLSVGLPDGVMGNSEVGHLNIGAGRIVFQELTRINESIRTGEFTKNRVLREACEAVKKSGGTLHVMGLLSDGGVHSHIDHLFALLDLAHAMHVPRVAVHPFLDGRDTSPTAGVGYMRKLQTKIAELNSPSPSATKPADKRPLPKGERGKFHAQVATVSGRYYSMDRDKRWERTKKAYDAIVCGAGPQAADPVAVVEASYAAGVTDEFVVPTVIAHGGKPVATVKDGDGIVFFNFRGDRARQITRAIAFTDFTDFQRETVPKLSTYTCFTEYDQTFPFPTAFRSEPLANIFGEVVSAHGLKQLRIAETEKYAHVTFFFNGGEERLYPGEDRCLIQSPRDVPTYDHKPEMSAALVAAEAVKRIRDDGYDVVILNFANADMVGHTGSIPAAIKAVETVDTMLGEVVEAVFSRGGALLVTADHGNCEEMLQKDGSPHTAHTTNPVPCLLIGDTLRSAHLRDGGRLCDLAPTLLELLKIPKPKEMTGESLIG